LEKLLTKQFGFVGIIAAGIAAEYSLYNIYTSNRSLWLCFIHFFRFNLDIYKGLFLVSPAGGNVGGLWFAPPSKAAMRGKDRPGLTGKETFCNM
jgi:hypothetical protein